MKKNVNLEPTTLEQQNCYCDQSHTTDTSTREALQLLKNFDFSAVGEESKKGTATATFPPLFLRAYGYMQGGRSGQRKHH